MFSQLKGIVDLVRGGIADFRKLKSKREREAIVVDVLKFYFLLKDCVDEGEKLVEEAGSDPVAKVSSLPGEQAIDTLTRWDLALRRQGMRLYALQGHIFGEHHLAVINPNLLDALTKAVGYKMQRAVTLHGIGATLFLRHMFPIEETNEEKARLVAVMAGAKYKSTLNLRKARKEIASLRNSLDEYRNVVQRLVSDDELLKFSGKARDATRFREEA